MGVEFEKGEPYVPEPPDDNRPPAEALRCFCGSIWYPQYDERCPKCGRLEVEYDVPDEELTE